VISPRDTDDVGNHGSEVVQDFGSRYSQYFNAMRYQPSVTGDIVFRHRPTCMRFPIHLHGQTALRTKEIQRIAPCRMLASKLEPRWPLAQFLPQQNLRQAHPPPELL